ncbi:MAG: type II secretion system F family protein, partial [Gammaproteobacteria bacterium]
RFPRMLIAMLRIGEETGQLDNMLESLADFYEDEVKATIEGLISMIEPLMMIVIGSIVGFILIALYLPIFRMGELIH